MPGASEPAQIPTLPILQYRQISVANSFIIWVSTTFFLGGYPNVHVHSNLIIANILPRIWCATKCLTCSDSKIHLKVTGYAPGCDLWCLQHEAGHYYFQDKATHSYQSLQLCLRHGLYF